MQNITFEDVRWVTAEEMLTMDILDGNREAVEKLVAQTRDRRDER
jgi:hypothetical protein